MKFEYGRNGKQFFVTAVLVATVFACAAFAGTVDWDQALIRGTTPGGKIFFEPNEEMAFTLTLEGVKETLPADTYFVDWERRGDDGLVEKGRVPLPLPKGGFVLKTRTAKPGFVCLEANVVTKDGKRVPKNHRWEKRVFFQGGAGVRPDEIPMATEPADYDAFWAACLKELDAVPMNAEMKPVTCKDKEVRLYAVRIPCAGPWPVTGYLTIPVKASKENRMPISANYRGASQDEQLPPEGGPHDRISMLINPNGYELGRGTEYVKNFFAEVSEKGYGYGMGPKGNARKETSYWKWCALRAIRYLQWLKSLPEWDGKELVISGGSQGDWQCYHAAAHVPGVTRMNGNGSWGGDWTGQAEHGRLRSTYRPTDWFPDMAYFDPVFAAKRITCPVNISFSGLGDYVSTPASLTLIYRNLKGPKQITYVQGSTHGWRPDGMQRQTVDGGWDAAMKVLPPPPKDVPPGFVEKFFKSKDLVYWLDAARADTLTKDAAGRVVKWASANGNGYAFLPGAAAPSCTNALNGKGVVSFGAAGRTSLVATGPATQRTVFVVCRPRRVATDFSGVWGPKGKDGGLRMAQTSRNWENVRGGPDFNSTDTLMVNGASCRGAVPFLPGDIQVLALRHTEDIQMWGATSCADFTPSVGEYVTGRFFDGDVAEIAAFSCLLSEDDCRAVSEALMEKWNPEGIASAFDPFDAVREAVARGERHVTIPKRLYLVKPKDGGVYLSLKGIADTTIDFSGSELRGLVNTGFFRLECCTNVQIRNVTLDYRTLPFTQATILSSDKDKTWTVKVIPGYPVPPDGGDGAWPFQVYDKTTLELKNPMRCWNGFKIEKTGADTFRVSGGANKTGDAGDYAVWGLPPPKGSMEGDHVSERDVVYCRATVRCVFENITEYATPGGRAFEEHLTEGNVYRNCRIIRRPPETDPVKRGLKRLRSGNHDAFMSRRAVEGPKILGCTAMYHCDDSVNISGMYGVVYEVKGKTVRLLEYIPSVFHVGDTTQAMSFEGKPLPLMTVTAVKNGGAMTAEEREYVKTIGLWRGLDALCRTAVEIEVDDASALKRGDAVISNRAQGNGFEIRGCHFGRNRALGIRLRASHGTIADNVIEHPEGCGIFVGPEYEWLEGGLPEDVTLTNNTLVGCQTQVGGAAAHQKRLERGVYRNLVVEGTADHGTWLDPVGYVQEEIAQDAKRISVPKARYWIAPKAGKEAYFEFDGLNGVEIDFNGSELVGAVAISMFQAANCTNLVIRNVSIDFAELPFTQAVIEKVDKDHAWDVRVIEGYPCPSYDQIAQGDQSFWPIQAYDAKTFEPKNYMRFRDNVAITRTGPATYRITGGLNRTGDVGDIAVWSIRETTRSYMSSAVSAPGCKDCLFEDVTVYATPHGCGFAEFSADGNTYRSCRLVRRPPETDLFPRAFRRLRSGNHDAFNSRCSYKGPLLDGCTFQYHCDDCVNISGFYAFVTKQEGRTVRLAPCAGQLRIDPGDTCQVMTFEGTCPPDVKVLSLVPAGATTKEERTLFESYNLWPGLAENASRAYTAVLDADVALPPGSVIISNRRMGNGFTIRNCTMGHNRARGLLIKASDGLMESNVLEGVEGSAVQITPEYEWMEGGCSRNITVRDNVLRRNGGGVVVAGNNGARKPLPAASHRNVVITGNRLSESYTGIGVTGCTGLDVRDNEIVLHPGARAKPVELQNVADVQGP
ncbi:MAG TPA: acetylxylan esterase [Kiritimatiellia bacterium]|nr:acetylxylan esterase [Kiritimatiellia bacterium]HPS07232.1 acetylxylan esterase [Kiritimatiellia bacterium]